MAKKKLAAVVKIQIPAGGRRRPRRRWVRRSGPHGINIMDFCKAYNAATENQRGQIIPAEISIYEDRTFTFVTKTPPTPFLLRQAAGIEKGSSLTPRTEKAGKVTKAQVRADRRDEDARPQRHRPRRRHGPGRRAPRARWASTSSEPATRTTPPVEDLAAGARGPPRELEEERSNDQARQEVPSTRASGSTASSSTIRSRRSTS